MAGTCTIDTVVTASAAARVEECDDGNFTTGDGCDATCQREAADCADGFHNDELANPTTCGLLGIEALGAWALAGAVVRRRRVAWEAQ